MSLCGDGEKTCGIGTKHEEIGNTYTLWDGDEIAYLRHSLQRMPLIPVLQI